MIIVIIIFTINYCYYYYYQIKLHSSTVLQFLQQLSYVMYDVQFAK